MRRLALHAFSGWPWNGRRVRDMRSGLRPSTTALLASALLAACGGSGGGSGGGSVDVAPPLVGATALAAAECAGVDLSTYARRVYVDSRATTPGTPCGATMASACTSIDAGIAACDSSSCVVVVRHGLYPTTQTLVLRNGVDVVGSCRFTADLDDGAAGKPVALYRTVIDAAPPPGDPAIRAGADLASTTRLIAVTTVLQDAAPTATSLGLVANLSWGLTLTRVTIASGRGGAGADGDTPAAVASEAGGSGGFAGTPGGRACAADGSSGHGGGGGAAQRLTFGACFITCNCQKANDYFGGNGSPSGSVAGGQHGDDTNPGNICTYPGNDDHGDFQYKSGRDGGPGACSRTLAAPVADLYGQFARNAGGVWDGTVWTPARGGAGGAGDVGSGGGGGTSGGACAYTTDLGTSGHEIPGGGGGGGGGGGCGGPGGAGGAMGGASIPLVMSNGAFVGQAWNGVVLVPGPGGSGGRGGSGAAGGVGGVGGRGVPTGPINSAGQSCPGAGGHGGNGGVGGAGSGGAGGNGGPSVGVARLTSASGAIAFAYAGAGGAPGQGGGGGSSVACNGAGGAAGLPGVADAQHDW